MRILLLSFYYPPDIGPGPLRAHSIVQSLINSKKKNIKIDVLTTIPNRYDTYKIPTLAEETDGPLKIRRIFLPPHKNGMIGQARAFYFFFRQVLKITNKGKWDIVVATSSRLITASLAALIAKNLSAKLYLDIRDLFTDTLDHVFAKSLLRVLVPIFYILELWTFRSANKINIVSMGFMSYINKKVPHLTPTVYTNGIDEIFTKTKFSSKKKKIKPIVLYTGNIGYGQGLDHVIPQVALLNKNINFKIIGDGGKKKSLVKKVDSYGLSNVDIIDPIPRHKLINEYKLANILFLHLNNHKSFQKVLPSKIFEYAATGKPILAGVSGYPAEFLNNQVKGVEVFDPCDFNSMNNALIKLINGAKSFNRKEFINLYNRKKIAMKISKDILSLND